MSECEQDEGHAFDNGYFAMDDLEEDEVDSSLLFVVRCILAAPKVEKEEWRRTSMY